jgi:hypothetical protein
VFVRLYVESTTINDYFIAGSDIFYCEWALVSCYDQYQGNNQHDISLCSRYYKMYGGSVTATPCG